MKTITLVFLILTLGCVNKETVTPQSSIIKWEHVTRLDPPADWDSGEESGRTKVAIPCDLDFKWWHLGTTFNQYTPTGGSSNNGFHWDVIIAPQWSSTGAYLTNFTTIDPSVQFKIRMFNEATAGTPNGTETFRYRINGGTWITLAPGQGGLQFILTKNNYVTYCDHSTNSPIGAIHYTVDIERLTCGPSTPHRMTALLKTGSVTNGHNFGQPGYAIHAPQLGVVAEASAGSCSAP